MPTTITGTDGVSQVQAGSIQSDDLAAGAITIDSGDLPAGSVIQVVQAVKTDSETFSLSPNHSRAVISNLSATITPINNSSKILVSFSVQGSKASTQGMSVTLQRNNNIISDATGNSAGTRTPVSAMGGASDFDRRTIHSIVNSFLDTPNTTSSITYNLLVGHTGTTTRTIYVNRSAFNTDDPADGRPMSTITLMEIAG